MELVFYLEKPLRNMMNSHILQCLLLYTHPQVQSDNRSIASANFTGKGCLVLYDTRSFMILSNVLR